MVDLPIHLSIVFGVAVVFTTYAMFRASGNSLLVLLTMVAWITLQSGISATGFYLETYTVPPRFALLPVPALLLIVVLFATNRGRRFIDALDPRWLLWLHVVRVPVEMVLYWLFIAGLVPELMTFEGRNLDILSGITAALLYWAVFLSKKGGRRLLLAWNFGALVLLFNIVVSAILSLPSGFQQMAFDQPNTGVLYFPFSLLPAFIVPAVLLSHLAAIRQLVRRSAGKAD